MLVKKITLLIFILFISNFVSANSINFDCQDSIKVNEEIICSLEIFGFDGVYDVKAEIKKDGKNIARIFNEESGIWNSAYYYLKDFIEVGDKKEIKLKIEEAGEFSGILKLRKGGLTKLFNFKLKILENNSFLDVNTIQDEEKLVVGEDKKEYSPSIDLTSKEKLELIKLNEMPNEKNEVVVYESKNYKILKYTPYAFSVFLIFIVLILLRDKF
tara:strand:+ start:253 stop:894 length:642 start_codon:yes stop_codon:yes gene_type:complete